LKTFNVRFKNLDIAVVYTISKIFQTFEIEGGTFMILKVDFTVLLKHPNAKAS
jgi:hypothetical protein